jgi:hypothetical protein
MRTLPKLLFATWLIALAASGTYLYAQAPSSQPPAEQPSQGQFPDPSPDPTRAPSSKPAAGDQQPGEATPDISVPMEKESQIAPTEMERVAREASEKADKDEKRVEQLKVEARKQKDVIKLNCINDKLLQIKQLLNILEDGLSKLSLAIAERDEGERYHRYTVIKISGEKIAGLRDEAEACVGEEVSYLGPLSVDVAQPDVPDDPTAANPWDHSPIEPPGYASPFE